jgi:deoxyribodipyrimidine photolyase
MKASLLYYNIFVVKYFKFFYNMKNLNQNIKEITARSNESQFIDEALNQLKALSSSIGNNLCVQGLTRHRKINEMIDELTQIQTSVLADISYLEREQHRIIERQKETPTWSFDNTTLILN